MKRFSILFAGLMLAGTVSAPADAAVFSSLFVFGDSLVDSGNAQLALPPSLDPAPAAAGYFQGRFSNGFNFADYLSKSLIGPAATPFFAGGTNFGVGGATASSNPASLLPPPAPPSPPGFREELVAFNFSPFTITDDALVVLTFGGNDIQDAVEAAGPGMIPDFSASYAEMLFGLNALVGAGARNLVIVGVPDIGLIPKIVALGPDKSALASDASDAFNLAFQNLAATLGPSLGVKIDYFDLLGLENNILADPMAFGLPAGLDSSTPCLLTPGYNPLSPTCDGFLYFDPIHPTTQVHEVIANAILAQLMPVPEPRSWLMLIAGLAMVGGLLRRRAADGEAAAAAA